jgi:hypothetical protein
LRSDIGHSLYLFARSWLLWLFYLRITPAQAIDLPQWLDLARWRDVRDWPFIPLPEVATDPNGDTTLGFLPVWLFTDDKKQIRRMFAPDLTYNPTLGLGGTLRFFSYPSNDTQWWVQINKRMKSFIEVGKVLEKPGVVKMLWAALERTPSDRFWPRPSSKNAWSGQGSYDLLSEPPFAC